MRLWIAPHRWLSNSVAQKPQESGSGHNLDGRLTRQAHDLERQQVAAVVSHDVAGHALDCAGKHRVVLGIGGREVNAVPARDNHGSDGSHAGYVVLDLGRTQGTQRRNSLHLGSVECTPQLLKKRLARDQMEAVLLQGLDQSASRATSSVERANEKLGIEYSSRPTWTHQADRREAERRTPRTARLATRATSRGLTPLARPRVRTSARAKRALGDRACLIMRISSSSAWTRPRTSLWRGIAHLETGYHRRRGVLLHFHNFNYKPYWIEPYLPEVREYTQSGGALAMVGGDLSFASGQYGESALRDVLPVDVAGIPAEGPRAFSQMR